MEIKECKVVLVGEESVGKTSIINRLCYSKFIDNEISTTTTSQVITEYIYENDEPLKMCLWDLAGRQMFRSLNRIFCKNAEVVVFVYSITDKKSFEEIKYYWYKEIFLKCKINPCTLIFVNSK